MISIDIGPETESVIRYYQQLGRSLRPALHDGLAEAVHFAGEHIGQNYLTNQALKARSGHLRQATQGWMESDLHGVIGVADGSAVDSYKWLLGDNPENQPKTIRPKNAKYLSIPIGDNLNASGTAKYSSPRDVPENLKATFFQSHGQLLFGYRPGKTGRARMRVLFVFKREVQVYDTGALVDGVTEQLDTMTETIFNHVKKAAEA